MNDLYLNKLNKPFAMVNTINQDPKSVTILFSPINYIYTSYHMKAYSLVESRNLFEAYEASRSSYYKWKRKYDRIKNSEDAKNLKSATFFNRQMKIAIDTFQIDKAKFISKLVGRLLENYDTIYIETPPKSIDEIKEKGFRGIKYKDQDKCKTIIDINSYDTFISELEEQMNLINEYNEVLKKGKELNVIPSEITISGHNTCGRCGAHLSDKDFVSCESQMVICPSCNQIMNEYVNMIYNVQYRLKQFNL